MRTTVQDSDLLSLHRALTTKELFRAVARMSEKYIPAHSLSIYFNYWDRGDEFQVIHKQCIPGRHMPWNERREFSPAGKYLRANPGVKMYRLDQLIPNASTLRDSAYFNKVMKEEGWRYLLVRGFWWQDIPKALIAFRRTQEQGEFKPHELDLLETLHPQIKVALDRIRRVQALEIKNLCLTSALEHLRQGVLLYNWAQKPIFKNAEGVKACHAWTHGARSLAGSDASAALELPDEIMDVAGELKGRWEKATGEDEKRKLLTPRSVVAGKEKRLTAFVQIIRSKRHPLAEPFLLIQFVDVHTGREWLDRHSIERNVCLERLTPREQEVARLTLAGLSNRKTSEALNKSLATVKAQLTSIYRKLGLANRAELFVLLK